MKKGNKPSFHQSAPPTRGKELYDSFIGQVRSLYREERVKDGVFGATMDVGLVNDGPVGVDFRCIDEAVYYFHLNAAEQATLTVVSRSLSRSTRVRLLIRTLLASRRRRKGILSRAMCTRRSNCRLHYLNEKTQKIKIQKKTCETENKIWS